MNKTKIVAIGILVALLVSVVLIYSFEKAITTHAISRLRERTDAYAKVSKTTTHERSASAGGRTLEGQGSSDGVLSSAADDGYPASSTSAPIPPSTQKR